MENIEVLLFDLGGVIVPWVGIDALQEKTGLSRDTILEKFSRNSIFRDYEIGACEDTPFAEELNAVFDLGLEIEAVKTLWNSWVNPPYTHTEDVLKLLRQTYKTACLSNTNNLHWQHLHNLMDMDGCFDMKFASQLLNCAKPDAEIYERAISALDIAPENILFFDDTPVNLTAAKEAGLQAMHVNREVGVIPKLKELGLIEAQSLYASITSKSPSSFANIR